MPVEPGGDLVRSDLRRPAGEGQGARLDPDSDQLDHKYQVFFPSLFSFLFVLLSIFFFFIYFFSNHSYCDWSVGRFPFVFGCCVGFS